jgi:hypothetical protein
VSPVSLIKIGRLDKLVREALESRERDKIDASLKTFTNPRVGRVEEAAGKVAMPLVPAEPKSRKIDGGA